MWILHRRDLFCFAAKSNEAADLHGSIAYKDELYADAPITDKGVLQCKDLQQWIEKDSSLIKSVQLVLVSPLQRALQTASLTLPFLEGKVPWIALESLREASGAHPCDRRRNKSSIVAEYPHICFDDLKTEEDTLYSKYQDAREPPAAVIARCNDFLEWLSRRTEDHIIVVSHSAYMDQLFGNVFDTTPENSRRLNNCEMRTFVVALSGRIKDP